MSEVPTYCRICESQCGLLATVDNNRVTALRPDPDHPVSKGYACRKGTHFHTIHHRTDRLQAPLVAGEATDWTTALAHVGSKLRALLDTHGPASVGLYSGNAAGHSLGAVLGLTALQRALETDKHYSCLTLDNSGMFVVTEACLGNPMHTFVADYEGSDCVVLIGTDPLSSQPSQSQSHPDGVRQLREAADHLWVVDPRRSATARAAHRHLAIRPGTDLWLLAWLLQQALPHAADAWLDEADLTALQLDVDPARTGLPTADLIALRDAMLSAERPLVWAGLGVLLGPHGTLGYWLTLCLQAVLGGLDRAGGWRHHRAAVNIPRLFGRLGVKGYDRATRSRIGDFPAVLGTVAAATLAQDILTPGPDQLRALIVVGGNPLVALPDTRLADRALRSLDLLVCIDLFQNDTGALAHAVLPASSWLARTDIAVHMAQQRSIAHLQLAEAVVPPMGDAQEDWWILTELARATGRVPFGNRAVDWATRRLGPTGIARVANAVAGRLPWSRLGDRGSVAEPAPGVLRDHPIELAVPAFVEATRSALGSPPTPGPVLVTSVRPIANMNSWIHRGTAPHARLAPSWLGDARAIRVQRPDGSWLELTAQADPHLQPGVVVLPFGWATANPNEVIGTTQLDVFTGQPVSNGGPVAVEIVG
jgi:formate dehydrogenase